MANAMFSLRELELLLKYGTFDIVVQSSGWRDGTINICPCCNNSENDFFGEMPPLVHEKDCCLDELKALKLKLDKMIKNYEEPAIPWADMRLF